MSREVRRVPANWQHPSSPTMVVVNGRLKYGPAFDPLHAEDMTPLFAGAEPTWWQMYETTSEGTPISPPMETPEELARWLAGSRATVFGDFTASYEKWMAMITGSGATVGLVVNTATGEAAPGWLDGQG